MGLLNINRFWRRKHTMRVMLSKSTFNNVYSIQISYIILFIAITESIVWRAVSGFVATTSAFSSLYGDWTKGEKIRQEHPGFVGIQCLQLRNNSELYIIIYS